MVDAIEFPSYDSVAVDIKNSIQQYNDNLSNKFNDINNGQINAGLDILNDEELRKKDKEIIDNMGDLLAEAWQAVWQEKRNRIENAWNTTIPITLKSLLDEVAPYALSIFDPGTNKGDLFSKLLNKVDDVIEYLLDIDHIIDEGDYDNLDSAGNKKKPGFAENSLSLLANGAIDISKKVTANPNVSNAISQLNCLKGIAEVFNGISNAISVIMDILKYLEPLKPALNISIDFILSFKTGGTSTARALNTITERSQYLCQQLLNEAVKRAKQFIFNIKINIPEILVESFRALDISNEFDLKNPNYNAISEWVENKTSGDDTNKFQKYINGIYKNEAIKSDEYYNKYSNPYTFEDNLLNSKTTPDYIGSFFSSTEEVFKEAVNTIYPDSVDHHRILSKVLKESTSNVLKSALRKARADANLPEQDDPIWTFNEEEYDGIPYHDDNYDESYYNLDNMFSSNSSISKVDQALLSNQLSVTYYTEQNIKSLSKRMIE